MGSSFVGPFCEALESRQLLSSADLALSFVSITGPDVLVPGDKGSVKVLITNVGPDTAVGTIDVSVRASTDTIFDLSDPLLTGLADKKINLAIGKTLALTLTMTALPDTVTPGNYYLVCKESSALSSPDTNPGNDADRSSGTSQVAWQFGAVGSRKNVKMTLHDGATPVVFALSGLGTGAVTSAGAFSTDTLTVTGSTGASKLTITTAKNAYTTLDSIQVLDDAGAGTGSLGSIKAARTNLETGVSVDGLLGSLTVHDIQSYSHYIRINTTAMAVPDKAAVSIVANVINGCYVNTGEMPVKSFKAANVTGIDLTAPWIGTFAVSSKVVGQGNLSGTFSLLSEPASNLNLSKLTVSGNMDGTTIQTETNIGSIQAGQWASGKLSTAEIKSFKIAGDLGAEVGAIVIHSAAIGGDLSGDWGTGWVGKVTVGGDMTGVKWLLGSQVDGGLDWNQLESLTVKGWIDSSEFHCFNPIGSITAGGIRDSSLMMGVTGTTLPTAAGEFDSHHSTRFKSVTVKGIKDGTGQYVESFINSNIAAWQIDALSFGYVATANATPFGIASHSIGKFTYKHFSGMSSTDSNMTDPAGSFAIGDMQVTIV